MRKLEDKVYMLRYLKFVVLCSSGFILVSILLPNKSIRASSEECSDKFRYIETLSDIETIDYYINLYLSNNNLTNNEVIKLSEALRDVSDIDQQSLDKAIDILIDHIRYDTGIWGDSAIFQYKFLTSQNLVNILIPIIAKYQKRADTLLRYLTLFFKETDYICRPGFFKTRYFLLRINNLLKLQLQKRLISNIAKLKNQDQLIILLGMLSDNAYLYLKNTDEIINFRYLTPFLKEKFNDSESEYIRKLSLEIIDRFHRIPLLFQEITLKNDLLQNKKINTPGFREELSILVSLYKEILLGRIPMDLSDISNIAVGCDILSASDTKHYFVEVKSRIIVSPREVSLSRNEMEVALNVYKNYPQGEYKIYVISVAYSGKKIFDPITQEVDINWDKLDDILVKTSYETLPKINISMFGILKEKE